MGPHRLISALLVALMSVMCTNIVRGQTMSDGPRSPVAPAHDEVIHLSLHLDRSPDEVFAYFTTSELVESWLAAVAEIEERVGGKYELYWDPEDRENNSTIGCRITAIVPNDLVAFQWRSPKQFKSFANAADPLTHVVIMFIPDRAGTRVHLVHSGWRSSAEWEEARVWQERAWSAAFKELERVAMQ